MTIDSQRPGRVPEINARSSTESQEGRTVLPSVRKVRPLPGKLAQGRDLLPQDGEQVMGHQVGIRSPEVAVIQIIPNRFEMVVGQGPQDM